MPHRLALLSLGLAVTPLVADQFAVRRVRAACADGGDGSARMLADLASGDSDHLSPVFGKNADHGPADNGNIGELVRLLLGR